MNKTRKILIISLLLILGFILLVVGSILLIISVLYKKEDMVIFSLISVIIGIIIYVILMIYGLISYFKRRWFLWMKKLN
jgi:hypothetical protein